MPGIQIPPVILSTLMLPKQSNNISKKSSLTTHVGLRLSILSTSNEHSVGVGLMFFPYLYSNELYRLRDFKTRHKHKQRVTSKHSYRETDLMWRDRKRRQIKE